MTGQEESKYDDPSDEDAIPPLTQESPVRAIPSLLPVSPPHSLALSPGLARRLAPVLTTQSPAAAAVVATHPAVGVLSTFAPLPIVTPPASAAYSPPSPPSRAQPIAVPPALSFPIHSVFAAPHAAVTHPASVEKAVTRSAQSTSHQRSLSASSAHSAPTTRQKQQGKATQKAKKRISLTVAVTTSAATATTASSIPSNHLHHHTHTPLTCPSTARLTVRHRRFRPHLPVEACRPARGGALAALCHTTARRS